MNYEEHLAENAYIIFLLHGVVERREHEVRNYNRKHIEESYFVDFLDRLLGAGGNPVSMDAVLESHRSRRALPPRSFAITFDDGFLNNLTHAAPILERYGIPATFYVTSDFIQSNRMSWIDRVEWAVEAADQGEVILPWRQDRAIFKRASEKIAFLDEVRKFAKSTEGLDLDALASSIQKQLGFDVTWSNGGALDQKMNWAQVKELNSRALFTVGGHSHSHGILSFLSEAALADELDTSLRLLRDLAGIEPRHYSYPEGLAHCYSAAVIEQLKKRGVEICPTAVFGTNDAQTDPFELRRIMVT
jgi:peptidoglycan/xylan/chitin deacetylase (PgdA/CDA1 family)